MKAIIALLVLGIFIMGCTQQPAGGNVTSPNVSNQTSSSAVKLVVHIKDFAFSPENITIDRGDTVVWDNQDSAPHIVKFPDFQSGALSNGQAFEHTFNEAGEFPYVCGIHASMHGKVIAQ
jgi:plastocyanin